MSATATLRTGASFPLVGLGTWQAPKGEVGAAVTTALMDCGYRHVDCAAVYGNEKEIGAALSAVFADPGGPDRGQVFLTSKLWNSMHEPGRVEEACAATLADLQLDYLDLYLIHWPQAVEHVAGTHAGFPRNEDGSMRFNLATTLLQTWHAMEDLVDKGMVRAIGLSNFTIAQIQGICAGARAHQPAVLQIESHPYFSNDTLVAFCQAHGIVPTAYSPLGSGCTVAGATVPSSAALAAIGARYGGKTAAQIALAWQVQRGVVVIPKSTKPARLAQNLDVLGVGLSADDMRSVSALNTNARCANGYGGPQVERDGDLRPRDEGHPDYPFRKGPQTQTVCVTGASGFLGTHTMVQCLKRGWVVHATTRSPDKHEARLRACVPEGVPAAHLKVFACDLLAGKEAFAEAFAGCDAVLHTASPFFVVGATEENVVRPAVEGTRNVLLAVRDANVKKVALTSSTAAIYGWYGKHPVDHVMTEADWSDEAALIRANNWYCVSKTRAERLAWEMSKEAGSKFKLAVMNPCLILGPMLQPALNTSSKAVLTYLTGERSEIQNCTKCIVDVRDVAEAHVCAVALHEDDADAGVWGRRHLLVGGCPSWAEIATALRDWAPTEELKARVPTAVEAAVGKPGLGANPPHATPFNVRRAECVLGLGRHKGVEEMVRATAESLQKWGLIPEDSKM
jgi:alcohol dehydrogenase (NADP+)